MNTTSHLTSPFKSMKNIKLNNDDYSPCNIKHIENKQINGRDFPVKKTQQCSNSNNKQKKDCNTDYAKKKKPFIEREGDWVCTNCKNLNFSFRAECNRCQLSKLESDNISNSRGRSCTYNDYGNKFSKSYNKGNNF
jgi:hypothetical protein